MGWERRTYEVMLLTRTIDATIARSEAALGRYVLDENDVTGTAYYNEWRSAGWQIGQLQRLVRDDPAQARRAARAARPVRAARRRARAGRHRRPARRGRRAASACSTQAGSSRTLPALRAKLEEIARAERANLDRRMEETQGLVARADAYTEWLGWLAILIGLGAMGLAILAWRAFVEGVQARREAEAAGVARARPRAGGAGAHPRAFRRQ